MKQTIAIPVGNSFIRGDLNLIANPKGLIIFAHGSGSSRLSGRNIFVADILNQGGFSTFLFDLLTPEEENIDQSTREFRFNIPLLAERLVLVTHWIQSQAAIPTMPIGYFGASTGAAAALIAAAHLPEAIGAVVSRGGRPDLAGNYLPLVKAATLLIIGQLDSDVIILNEKAYALLSCHKKIEIVPGATHLFEEKGTLQIAAQLAQTWFTHYLR